MKFILTAITLGISLTANAEIISCGFSEPFMSFTYDTSKETLSEREAIMNENRVLTGVTFQIKYAGTFLLKSKAGKLLAELKLNNNGSDGMSGAIYPYEAKYIGAGGGESTIYGGCTSSLKPMVRLAD
ncbi:MAG TPA: hypothetical protein VNJ01_08725 [Bacteriovoracaceae bacterium]|nr:hypothetical protein [Bacteriovoracaceae bacterium]